MIGYLVKTPEEIETIPRKTQVAVVRFRPSIKMMIDIKKKEVKVIVIPKSAEQCISENMKPYASQIGLKVITSPKDGRGRRSDIHGHMVELNDDYSIKEI